jgi:hypothetical protein
MAYPLNEAEMDSEEKLQLYNFRKLNHGNLVAVEAILCNEEDYLCSFPKSRHILVEHIPLRLAAFNRVLSFHEGVTILSAAFAGYNTLNYVYGPLFTSELMIGFTALGVPKVWVNQNFAINEPSKAALNGGEDVFATSIEERVYCCVQKIFDIVEVSVAGGYPSEFKSEAAQISTFAEGEEFVDNFCRRRGVPLDDRISLNKVNKVEPLHFQTETHLQSERLSLNTFVVPNTGNARTYAYL